MSSSALEVEPGQLLPGYRGAQVAHWIYALGARQWEAMTNLPKELRAELAARYRLSEFQSLESVPSQDGSVRYLFTLLDGQKTEAVYMPYPGRKTLCLSTMVGCSAGCRFCATGALGFGRNLSSAEILDQLLAVAADQGFSPREVRNVVLMGMGEPLLNLEAVLKALRVMLHPQGLALSPRRVTLSTVGIPRGIRRLAQEGLGVRLAVSLHAPDEETRQALIPTARRHALEEILEAVREYQAVTRWRVTFEYTLLAGLNDRPWQAQALAERLRGLKAHLNLIPFNPWPGAPVQGSSPEDLRRFAALLKAQGIPVSIRWSRGQDVGAACGQLALRAARQDGVDLRQNFRRELYPRRS